MTMTKYQKGQTVKSAVTGAVGVILAVFAPMNGGTPVRVKWANGGGVSVAQPGTLVTA